MTDNYNRMLSETQIEGLRRLKHIALDMDGTIYLGSRLFPFTLDFLDRIEALGIGCTPARFAAFATEFMLNYCERRKSMDEYKITFQLDDGFQQWTVKKASTPEEARKKAIHLISKVQSSSGHKVTEVNIKSLEGASHESTE